ncbi:hypothetical protein I553_0225 [Mycobacterium xenopi 4042]|uniref:Uncharacterized protein n=1 Tax=Mycobacterium xenopi 4042 TaxID=1299334 RepID=X7YIW9_MYCXE|nr:hypothetical protein I553_0225 [Mycobacterium xenopi 4042]
MLLKLLAALPTASAKIDNPTSPRQPPMPQVPRRGIGAARRALPTPSICPTSPSSSANLFRRASAAPPSACAQPAIASGFTRSGSPESTPQN